MRLIDYKVYKIIWCWLIRSIPSNEESKGQKWHGEYKLSFQIDGQKYHNYKFLHTRSCTRAILGLNFLEDQQTCSYHFHKATIEINGTESELQSMPKSTLLVRNMWEDVILPRTVHMIDARLEMKKNKTKVDQDMYAYIDLHTVYASDAFEKSHPELRILLWSNKDKINFLAFKPPLF